MNGADAMSDLLQQFPEELPQQVPIGAPIAKKPRLLDPEQNELCFKVVVSPNCAGKIIGRGGSEIKALRETLGVGLHIHGSDNVFPKAPHQQIAVLFGRREQIDASFEVVVAKIVETEVQPGAELGPLKVSVLLTMNAVSAIIGTKGATIKSIREESGCNISADVDTFMGEQLVHVTGQMERLPMALAMLTPFVERSGDSIQYAEVHYGAGAKGIGAKGYAGGFDGGYGAKGAAGKNGGYCAKGEAGKAFAAPNFDKGKGKGKAPMQVSSKPLLTPTIQPKQVYSAPQAAPQIAIDEEAAVMESPCCISFAIPKDSISRVLGKGGSSSKEIRRLTGVMLKIDPCDQDPTSQDGVVSLSGPLHAVHKAHCMVVGRVMSPY